MKSLLNDGVFQIIVVATLVVLGMNIGVAVYPLLQSEDENKCTSGVIKERVERLEPTSEDNVSQVMKYYTIQCDDGTQKKVKAFKSFPLETRIGKEWVRQGNNNIQN